MFYRLVVSAAILPPESYLLGEAGVTELGVPVFGIMAGNLVLGEAFTPSLAAALALAAWGIYLVNRPQSR